MIMCVLLCYPVSIRIYYFWFISVFFFQIKLSVISAWIKSCNPLAFSVMMLFYLVYLSAQAAGNIWLSKWSSDPSPINGSQDIPLRNLRLGVYGGIGGIQGTIPIYSRFTLQLIFGKT